MTKPGKDMRAAIATAHSAAYYAAIKERTGVMPKGLSKIERAELKARVAEQLKYYDAFAEQAGDMSEAAVAARAQMYAGAIRGTYFQSRYPGLSQYPGDGSTQCLTNCKCNLDERDDGIYWVLNAGESCGDCETMAANSPYGLDETKAVKAQTDQERAMFARMDGGKGPGKGYDKSKSVLKDDTPKGGGGSSGDSAANAGQSGTPLPKTIPLGKGSQPTPQHAFGGFLPEDATADPIFDGYETGKHNRQSVQRMHSNELIATQHLYDSDYLKQKQHSGIPGSVEAYRYKGKVYIMDGHHRALLAHMKNEPVTVKIRENDQSG